MINWKTLRLAALSAIISCGAAVAAETMKVQSGRTVTLGFVNVYDKSTCGSAGKPDVSFKQPANGTLRVEWASGKNGAKDHCNGRLTKGFRIIYASKKGFRGNDNGVIYFNYRRWESSPSKETHRVPVNVDVR